MEANEINEFTKEMHEAGEGGMHHIALIISVGGLVEIVPLYFQSSVVQASPGVKPAAMMLICITCSWKIGTPSVRPSASFRASDG